MLSHLVIPGLGTTAVATPWCIPRLAFPRAQTCTGCGCEAEAKRLTGRRKEEGGSFQRPPELLRVPLQLLGLGLEVPQGGGAGMLEYGVLGGQRQVLEQAAEAAAATQDLVAHVPLLGLLAQRVHQLLPDHDDQLALRDEDLGGLAVAETAVQHADGFEERPEIEAAVFREADFLLRVLLTQRSGAKGTRILEKVKETMDKREIRKKKKKKKKREIRSTGCGCLSFPVFAQFARRFVRKSTVLFGKPHSITFA